MTRSPRRGQRVTVREVARAARVHFSTVSRVMNPETRDQITESVAKRVLKAAERLGYRTNALAAGLRTRRSRVVGIIVPYIDSPLYPPILLAIEEVLNERGYVAIICNTQNDPAREERALAEMMGRQVDGLILGTATRHDPIVEAWVKRGAPLVMINRTDQTGRAPSVITDDLLGIGLVIDHLAQLGHQAIGHIAGPQQLSTGAARSEGFRRSLVRLRLRSTARAIVVAEDFTREAGRRACHRLLNQFPQTTAIAAANDLLALGCYEALRERGLSCPKDVSVTGYNDSPFVDLLTPPLTTVRIPQREIGIQAAHTLLHRIEEHNAAINGVVLRPELIVRQSTAAPRLAMLLSNVPEQR
ncbi:MAG: LacI family DNA-binding transcriptional regulator [Alphaproteobacteria bacterium]|nr:LacI family DNA-binding transcriptional regulator [Alphaproteobacteria bacterium]